MSKTILIVDDCTALRQVARMALEKAGYAVQEAADGREALQRLDLTQPHLIVCDLHMPVMDGLGLLKALADRRGAVPPVVMLSTDTAPDPQKQATALGAKAWLSKPFRPLHLVQAAERFSA